MLEGSCLCGGIRYVIDGELGPIIHCHCGQCRKASGASFATNAPVDADRFRFVSGEELLGQFESSPGQFRCFCTRCGSPLIKRMAAKPDVVRLRLGTLDSDPGGKPIGHFLLQWKAPWTDLDDGLPQHG
ncbi:MAG: GFA family protein [Proteobacteria bacterium]|nr:GFA family protein [Pseudomonadota bacterium]MCZ6784879.1 GFA family protein [Pseudomonadota bacterium]